MAEKKAWTIAASATAQKASRRKDAEGTKDKIAKITPQEVEKSKKKGKKKGRKKAKKTQAKKKSKIKRKSESKSKRK